MEWATPVDHRLGYSEFLQEWPRANKNEDGLLQGLTVRLALWPHSFWSVFGTCYNRHITKPTMNENVVVYPEDINNRSQFNE